MSISDTTQPKAQMSARRSTGVPRACSGDMYRGRPKDLSDSRHSRRRDRGGIRRRALIGPVRRPRAIERLCKSEIEDLDRAIRAQFDVRGLQIAMNDSGVVDRLDRVRHLPAIGSASSSGIGPRAIRSARSSPSTSAITSADRPFDC